MNMKNIKGRRMPFENEIEYTRELMENHPDPSAEWSGGSGSEYEAGTGIDITEESGTSTISIDDTVVALKEDIITSYNDLTDKPTIPTVDYPVTDVQVNGTSVLNNKVANVSVPTTATSSSSVTPTTSAFVTGTSTTTETLTFTYSDNTTATITIVTSVTDSTSNAMTGASVSTTTTLS